MDSCICSNWGSNPLCCHSIFGKPLSTQVYVKWSESWDALGYEALCCGCLSIFRKPLSTQLQVKWREFWDSLGSKPLCCGCQSIFRKPLSAQVKWIQRGCYFLQYACMNTGCLHWIPDYISIILSHTTQPALWIINILLSILFPEPQRSKGWNQRLCWIHPTARKSQVQSASSEGQSWTHQKPFWSKRIMR